MILFKEGNYIMQKTIEDKWDVQLSEQEMKLLSEFKAADQILFSLKILVSSNFKLANIYKQMKLKKYKSCYDIAFTLEELAADVNLTNQKLEGINALLLLNQNKPIPLKLLQRLYSRIQEAILFNMKFFTTTKKKAGLILKGLSQTLEKNVVGQEFKVKKIVDTLMGFMQQNQFLLEKMEHLIEQKNIIDALGGYAQSIVRDREEAQNQKKAFKKARVSFAQFSGIEGIQIQEYDNSSQTQEVHTQKQNTSSKADSHLNQNQQSQDSTDGNNNNTINLEQNENRSVHSTKKSIKTAGKGKRTHFETSHRTRNFDHSRKKSFALEALGYDFQKQLGPMPSMFSAKSSHLLFKTFSPPLQRLQLSPVFKRDKAEIRRASRIIQRGSNQLYNNLASYTNQSNINQCANDEQQKPIIPIIFQTSNHKPSIIKPILTNKQKKRKYVSADFTSQSPYSGFETKQLLDHFQKQNYRMKGSPTVKTFVIGNDYWGKLKMQNRVGQIHQQHRKRHHNSNFCPIETKYTPKHQDVILQKIDQKKKSEKVKFLPPQDIYIGTKVQQHIDHIPNTFKKPRKSNILKQICSQNFKQNMSGKVFQSNGILTPKQTQEDINKLGTNQAFRKGSYFAIKPKVYEIYNTKNRQLFQN